MTDQLTLNKLFDRGRKLGRERFVSCYDQSGQTAQQSYTDFCDDIVELAHALVSHGMEKGDRVASLAGNSIEHLQLMWAVPLAGGVFHAINPKLTQGEIAYIFDASGDRFLFADINNAESALRLVETPNVRLFGLGAEAERQFGSASHGLDQRVTKNRSTPEFKGAETEAAVLCYTSGTTGRPKGVTYSHRALTLHAMTEAMVDGYGIGRSDTVLLMVPFCHGAAWGLPYSTLMCGAEIAIFSGSPKADAIAPLLKDRQVTFTAAVPEVMHPIATVLRAQNLQLPNLRVLMGGTAPSQETISNLHSAGVECLLCWGMTETLSAATMLHLPPSEKEPVIGQGQPLPLTEISLSDGTDSAPELLVRGPCVVETYFGSPKPARDKGWFPTGDTAEIDDDGSLRLQDRKKDLIKSGGEWISPAALEDEIARVPDVQQCAVIGVAHPKWGERPLCFIVASRPVTEVEVLDSLQASGRFAKWQLPDAVVLVETLPLTGVGKLDREVLREEYAAFFTRETST